jgi:hypothetical protein
MDKLFLPYKAHSTPAVYSIKKKYNLKEFIMERE